MVAATNVVLLSVDALRADHLSCYGYERTTSPTLDGLAADGVRFDRAYSQSSHTREAVPAMLTGRDPDVAVDEKYLLAADTIATRLSERAVSTAAFHSNPFVSRAYGFDRDFDAFDDDLHLGQHRLFALAQRALDKLRNRHYARAAEINERAFDWLDDHDRPFFLWNHYMDVHGPYEPPEPYRTRFGEPEVSDREAQKLYKRAIDDPDSITEAERQTLLDLYDGEIAYVDEQIRRFVDGLRDRGLWNETLVLVTADHGDAFGEHGYYEHPRYLHEELTRVPLVAIGGGLPAATPPVAASTADLVPTVLDALGFDAETLPGESMEDLVASPDTFADRTVFSQARGEGDDADRRRFAARNREGACFLERDLTDGTVLSEDGSEGDRSLLSTLREYSRERIGFGDTATDVGETEAVSDRLEALGYKE
jgi:arylsulfatase